MTLFENTLGLSQVLDFYIIKNFSSAKWETFSGFSNVIICLVGFSSLLLIIELFYVLVIIHLVLTKQPFILRMNPVNPRVRKPVITLCNILWWLHQALHHWLDYRGSGLLTHNLCPSIHTHFASHFIAPYAVWIKSHHYFLNSAHLVKRVPNCGINVLFMFLFLCQNTIGISVVFLGSPYLYVLAAFEYGVTLTLID